MNIIEQYKTNGLSVDGKHKINLIIGCINAGLLSGKEKRELVAFMKDLEAYLAS